MVDYSRFEHIGSSSDEDEQPAEPWEAQQRRIQERMAGGEVFVPTTKDLTAPRFENETGWRLDLHPEDMGRGLRRVFRQNPHAFEPVVHEPTGTATMWGLPDEDDEGGGMATMMRRMSTQFLYVDRETPEQQFVNVLVERKRGALARGRDEAAQGRDLVVRVALAEFWRRSSFEELAPSVWRRLRVSGALNLAQLHDRVLGPAMGWARNYHGYFYTDFTEGAVWCPLGECNAVDMMHASQLIVGALEPSETTLGELLREPGDRIGYTYDLGDFFEHVITLEEVVDADASTGAVAVLGGAMRCPNEDGDGNAKYQEEVLDHWLACDGVVGDVPLRFAVGDRVSFFESQECFGTPKWSAAVVVQGPCWDGDREWCAYRVRKDDGGDYYCIPCDHDDFVKSLDGKTPDESRERAAARALRDACSKRVDAMNVRPGAFDPAEFDLEACRARVRDAIGSKASAMEGAKQFTSGGGSALFPAAPGRATTRQVNGVEGGFALTETVSTRPDRREERVCATCGSPKNLSSCAKCKSIFYCGAACQRDHWKTHKADCARLLAEYRIYKKEKKKAAAEQAIEPNASSGPARSKEEPALRLGLDSNLEKMEEPDERGADDADAPDGPGGGKKKPRRRGGKKKKKASAVEPAEANAPRAGKYRFAVGDSVLCLISDDETRCPWKSGTVIALDYKESNWAAGKTVPYQVELDDGELVFAPFDNDTCIRAPTRFAVGDIVECNSTRVFPSPTDGKRRKMWTRGRVSYVHVTLQKGELVRCFPYEVEVDSGATIYVHEDREDHVRAAAGSRG